MKGEKCYMCDDTAKSREHIPPLCLFPEQKDAGVDFRKRLITVPSCDEHNAKKSNDDEFLMTAIAGVVGNNIVGFFHNRTKIRRAIDKKYEGFIETIIRNAKHTEITTKTGRTFPVLVGEMDMERMRRCLDHVVRGLYYHEFGTKLNGTTQMLFGFVKYKDKALNTMVDFLKTRFQNESDNYEVKGFNRDVFYYQIVPRDNFGLILFKLTFYSGTDVFVTVADEQSSEPFDLGTELILKGHPVTIEYDGKNYEFNKDQ